MGYKNAIHAQQFEIQTIYGWCKMSYPSYYLNLDYLWVNQNPKSICQTWNILSAN